MKHKIFMVAIATIFAITCLFASTLGATVSAHAVSQKPEAPTSTYTAATYAPDWITKADPYVHTTNGVATIDPALNRILSSSDLTKVHQAVQRYNSLPISTKTYSQATSQGVMHPAGCSWPVYHWYWWGYAYTVDHCMVGNLYHLVYIGDIAAAVGVFCGAFAVVPCAIIAGLSAIYVYRIVSDLNNYDSYCNNNGANLNFAAGSPLPFVNGVC